MTAPAAGATLCNGRYRLDDVVGRGGMAIVWGATDTQLERRVAIKVISDVLATDPRFVARFEREARLAAGLNHPNLVKLFDYSTDDGRPFLVMEYVAGGTLAQAKVPPDPLALARELLDALAHIHEAGILHRDIKPANVLLDTDGSPRLTDFGIARGEEQTGLTLTGQVMGTLRYIAPEVAAGEPATARSDLYSVGVLLGEMAGASPEEPLASLLRRLTAPEPADRPGSAREALAELAPTRALPSGSQPVRRAPPPPPVGPALHASEPPVRHIRLRVDPRRLAIASLVVCLGVLFAIVLATGGGSGNGTSKDPARTPVAQPAPANAPLRDQLNRLEQIIRSAPETR